MPIPRPLRLAAVLVAVLSALNAAPARAENPVPRPGVSLGARGAHAWNEGTSFEDGDHLGGVQLRAHVFKTLAVEASVDYREQSFEALGTDVDVLPVQLSALLYVLPDSRVSPFLLGGVGWYHTRVRGPAGFEQTRSRFGPHAGGGLQFFLSRRFSLDASYRYLFTEDIRTRSGGADVSIDGQGHMLTGGLNFHF